DFIVSLGCENGRGNSSIFHPRLTYTPTSPRRENTHLRTLNTEEPLCPRARLSSAFVTTCAEVDAGKQHVGASASWASGPAMSCRDPREGGAGISPAASARCGSSVSATMSTWAFSDYSCP